MKDEDKTKQQMISEVQALRAQISTAGEPRPRLEHEAADRAARAAVCTVCDGLTIDRMPLAYLRLDLDNRVVEWNSAAERIFGYTKDEVLGQVSFGLFDPLPLDESLHKILLGRIRARNIDVHSVNENRTKDGRTIICECFNSPLFDAEGTYVGVLRLAWDVTEQKQAEAVLARNALLLANVQDAVIVTDMDGTVTYWNEGATRLFGWRVDEMLGRPLLERIPASARAEMATRIQSIRDGKEFVGEWEDYRKDGSRVWVDNRGVRVTDATGKPVGLMGFGRDISERKRAEERLRESYDRVQALTRRLLAVQEEERRHLASELHDEIGQLLTSLKFAVEAIASAPQGTPQTKLNEARALIEQALTRVRELSFDLRPALLDLLGLLPALHSLIERYTASSGIQVNFKHDGLDRRFAPELETAAYRIVQEALTNVARYAGVSDVAVRVWVDQDTLKVQVEDQGAGFDYQAKSASGRSCGLPGMHERVTSLGGRLAIESAPGSGTQLMAELPVVRPNQEG